MKNLQALKLTLYLEISRWPHLVQPRPKVNYASVAHQLWGSINTLGCLNIVEDIVIAVHIACINLS